MNQSENLNRYELKQSAKNNRKSSSKLTGKLVNILVGILIVAAVGWVLTRPAKEKISVETIPDQGRSHVPAGTAVEYNSNPPTSGPHSAIWEKPGIYDRVLEDGKLVHSLEHGYIVISYNCAKEAMNKKQETMIKQVYAHETEDQHEETPASDSAEVKTGDITGWKDNPDCQNLVGQIKQITKKTGMDRLIVVPRPDLDVPIALTAWTKLLKLEKVDEDKIVKFVAEFRNKGPEKTME